MASTTVYWRKSTKVHGIVKNRICHLTWVLLFSLTFISTVVAKNKIITNLQTYEDGFLNVTPLVNFSTSGEVKEAIDNGVRIQLIVKSQVFKKNKWWFDEIIDNQKVKLEIYAFKLGQLYVAKNLTTNEKVSFNEYEQLLEKCFQIVNFKFQVDNMKNLSLRTRVMLDYSTLPTTMQLPVLLSNEWNLNTEWDEEEVKRK